MEPITMLMQDTNQVEDQRDRQQFRPQAHFMDRYLGPEGFDSGADRQHRRAGYRRKRDAGDEQALCVC